MGEDSPAITLPTAMAQKPQKTSKNTGFGPAVKRLGTYARVKNVKETDMTQEEKTKEEKQVAAELLISGVIAGSKPVPEGEGLRATLTELTVAAETNRGPQMVGTWIFDENQAEGTTWYARDTASARFYFHEHIAKLDLKGKDFPEMRDEVKKTQATYIVDVEYVRDKNNPDREDLIPNILVQRRALTEAKKTA